ncbi:MAG: hypothetical protein HY902_16810 [Deltaproteobacteria bacterium]|nr:hypothetical protein [Deltaproteobacteria bacterium]
MAPIFYILKSKRIAAVALGTVLAATALTGCAAMRRTWQFQAEATSSPALQVKVESAAVSQRRLAMQLRLHNPGAQPITIQAENATLTLPDGQEFTSSVGGLQSEFAKGLANIGIGKAAPPVTIAPGESVPLEISISQGRRDLRRFATLQVRLPDLRIDGQPATLAPLVLRAPADAPLGEDI